MFFRTQKKHYMNYLHCIKDYFFGEQKLYKFKSVDIVGSPQTLVDAKKYFQIYFGKQEQLLKLISKKSPSNRARLSVSP